MHVGCSVLEISKLQMYKNHYGFMKENVDIFELLHGDTDSFIYKMTGQNFYEIMLKHKEHFDLSNFPKDGKYFCNDNKKSTRKNERLICCKNYLRRWIWKSKSIFSKNCGWKW